MKWIPFVTKAPSLDYDQTYSYIHGNPLESYTLLDVRQPSEYEHSHIPGTTLIPLPQLTDRLSELDQDKPVLVY